MSEDTMIKVPVVMTGRSYQLAAELPAELELAEDARLADALAAIEQVLPEGESLPASCLVAVAGFHLGTVARHDNPELKDGQELVLIAPVAGG
jgi:molybdopterin converting factor small subunit